MNRAFAWVGNVACLAAVIALCGGHWFALQTVAWGRMLVDFSRHDSLGTAVAKTFDGRHPCPLCLKVRQGWQQDKQREADRPWLKTEKMPELVWQWRCLTAPPAPTGPRHEQPLVPILQSDFMESPPTPPPRVLFARL